jgi:hypothetical protein
MEPCNELEIYTLDEILQCGFFWSRCQFLDRQTTRRHRRVCRTEGKTEHRWLRAIPAPSWPARCGQIESTARTSAVSRA